MALQGVVVAVLRALAHLAFEAHGITQPPSFVWSADGVRDRRVGWQGETLLKPLYGNRGSGIEICGCTR